MYNQPIAGRGASRASVAKERGPSCRKQGTNPGPPKHEKRQPEEVPSEVAGWQKAESYKGEALGSVSFRAGDHGGVSHAVAENGGQDGECMQESHQVVASRARGGP
ncbi:hypothetical protein GOP47_0021307 [Adiantum capillus-veneris]|uniref:Uncharacterized protein n=1 Tax=Adiantum capillus-veneris TaxID=13818 RepID=A0A9D4UB98_ADICA|nr:hypothetical protein GOP47_0021307 [Adiantum capillus-veneris]